MTTTTNPCGCKRHPTGIRWRERGEVHEGRYRGADGRQRSVYAKSVSEVRVKLADALQATRRGEVAANRTVTTGAWLDTWMRAKVEGKLRPQTVTNYRGVVDRYLKPEIGRVPVARLSVDDVARMMAALESRPCERRPGTLSARTRALTLSVLRIALGYGVTANACAKNPAKLVSMPTIDQQRPDPYTIDQMHTLIEATRDLQIGPLVVLSATTGLRQGEALALAWADVDLVKATLSVNGTLDPHTQKVGLTKTKGSRRTIRLPRVAIEALEEQQRRQRSAGRLFSYVFATSSGEPLEATNVDRAYHKAREDAGLPHRPWHSLRHYAATVLLQEGDSLFAVSKMLGHSAIATTANTYAHLTPAMAQESADRMEAAMRRGA
jgi:integrase